ncbi:hypothetical protein [Bacillus sp. AK031]
MKKWVISAVVYLLLVTAGYTVYAQFSEVDSEGTETHEPAHK